MDNILSMFGNVIIAAFLTAIATSIIKRIVPEEYHEARFYSSAVNGATVVLSFLIVAVVQRLGFIPAGWEWLVTAGILTAGLAVLGYEGIKNILAGVAGDSVSGDKVDIDQISGGSVNIK